MRQDATRLTLSKQVWVTAELQVLREKHDKQSCRVIELERELAGSNANMRGRGGGKSGASREDKVSADMIASLKQILVYGQVCGRDRQSQRQRERGVCGVL